tara:strand:- start:234 stop:560 length:327 start_codon:yes stop_codon:yes gene_type:complete
MDKNIKEVQRHYGMMSGKGFRKDKSNSNRKSGVMTKADKLRIEMSYKKSKDKYYKLGMDVLEGMVYKGSVYEDRGHETPGKKLSGALLEGFRDAYKRLLQEHITSESK